MPRASGSRMTPMEREEALAKAFELSCKGFQNVEIARELDVNRNTVTALLKEARAWQRSVTPDAKLEALAHYSEIIREAWTRLERIPAHSTSYVISGLLNAAIHSQERKDKLNGVEAPTKSQVHSVVERYDTSRLEVGELDQLQRLLQKALVPSEN